MVTRILNYRFIQLTLSVLIIIGTLICVFTPNYFLFKMGAQFAVQIMLGYLFLGLVFLVFKQPKLMFTSFACCAGLCLFLKYSTDGKIAHAERTGGTVINIAHFNVSANQENVEHTIKEIKSARADLISFQETNEDWNKILFEELGKDYPYSKTDPSGLAVYSRLPILDIDTFQCGGVPNIYGTLELNRDKKLCFITTHALPTFYSSDYDRLRKHLNKIADHCQKMELPVITIGDYSAVPWSYEIQDFRNLAQLGDSRRGVVPASNGSIPLMHIPTDHIFYSREFECVGFEDINSSFYGHLGIKGSYQFVGNTTL